MRYRGLTSIGALTALALLSGCRDEAPPTTGAIAIRLAGSVPDHITSVRATVAGPEVAEVTLVDDGPAWVGTASDLDPGTYTVLVRQYADAELDAIGRQERITVAAGTERTAIVSVTSVRPVLQPVDGPRTGDEIPVAFSAVPGATGYEVEWSASGDFTDAGRVSVADTGPVIAIDGVGQFHLRARAILDGLTGGASNVVSLALVGTAFTGDVMVGGAGAFADTIRVAPGNVTWDGDEAVTVAGIRAWTVSQSPTGLVALMPEVPGGPQEVVILNQGATQLRQRDTVTAAGGGFARATRASAPELAGGSAPSSFFISLANDAADPGATSPDGPDDHYVKFTPGAFLGMRITVEWQDAADVAVSWLDATGTAVAPAEDNPSPQMARTGLVIPPGSGWRAWFRKRDRDVPAIMARVTIEQTPIGSSITAGAWHSCAIQVDGEATCWGYNGYGQLGDGTRGFRAAPASVAGGHTFSAITAGDDHTCAIDEAAAAWCWGRNGFGQLGDGSTTDRTAPTPVLGGRQFVALAAGAQTTCGLTTSGTAYCWGFGANGERGDGTTAEATSSPVAVTGGQAWQAIAVGRDHACGVTTAGAAYCWGANGAGALGTGGGGSSTTPVAVAAPIGDGAPPAFTRVSAGDSTSCAWNPGAAAYCWGNNSAGQLGNGTTTSSATPTPVSGGPWASITVGERHACGITGTGAARCWGDGAYGELGTGGTAGATTPVDVAGLGPAAGIAAGRDHSCAVIASGEARCWGSRSSGQLGDGVAPATLTPTAGPTGVVAAAAGKNHACAVQSGNVICWGAGADGQLGDGAFANSAAPVTVAGSGSYTTVTAGSLHTCALDTSGAAWCWGYGSNGSLGSGSNANTGTPVAVAGGRSWSAITAGDAHTCAIETGTADAYCWGANASGELGNGTTVSSNSPVLVSGGLDLASISAGANHTCGLTPAGAAWCWGFNGLGELGIGTLGAGSTAPVAVQGGLTFRAIVAGRQYTCGVDQAFAAYCWGDNRRGQLATEDHNSRQGPAAVEGGASYTTLAVSLGAKIGNERLPQTCGVTTTGLVQCWGANVFGALGDGTLEDRSLPVTVAGTAATALVAGGGFTCGLSAGQALSCWGANADGQVGIGTRAVQPTPVVVAGGASYRGPPVVRGGW